MGAQTAAFNPFPGLRPFEPDENHLFFGRDQQIDELLRRLGRESFVAVTGESGSGKSSLIRAGLLPALYGGFIARAGSAWRIAIFRPGADPIGRLANALADTNVLGSPELDRDTQVALLETTLRRSGRGLIEAARQARMAPAEQLLIVVDQFEEIFRFKRAALRPAASDEASAFVKLLLECVSQQETPLFVILTLRSDFLGDCAEFHGLPEAINKGIFLIPRMSRDELRLACEGPVRVAGGEITPRLLQTLLNEVGDDPDQLPLLQHALMRSWDHCQRAGNSPLPLDLVHYEAIGSLRLALSLHADEAYFELDEAHRPIAEKLFKCLCDRGPDNREVRHPSPLSEICEVTEAGESAVVGVVDCFRSNQRSFLMPPAGFLLEPDTVIDIGHESLIRQWQRLRDWVREESESRDVYLRLADAAERHAQGKAALWRDPELQLALDWQKQHQPTAAWGRRFHPAFGNTLAFLDASRRNREEEKRRAAAARRIARRQGYIAASVVLTVIFGGLLFIAIRATRQLENQFQLLQVGKLAVEARSVVVNSASLLERSILLAVEALRRIEQLPQGLPIREELSLRSRAVLEYGLSLLTRPALRLPHSGSVYNLAFSNDGQYLATGSVSGAALWSRRDGKRLARWDGGPVTALGFGSDNKALAFANGDGFAVVIDPRSTSVRSRLGQSGGISAPIRALAFSRDGRFLLTGDEAGRTCVWDIARGEKTTCLTQGGSIRAVAFSPDGHYIASGSSDNTACMWRWREGKPARVVKLHHRDTVQTLAFSPDGHYLVTGSDDATVAVWDVRQDQDAKRLLKTLPHGGPVKSLAFGPDGRVLATASVDHMLRLWNWPVSEPHAFRGLKQQDAILAVAFSPDGRHVATASEDVTGRIWEVESGREVARLAHHTGPVSSVAYAPDGSAVATGSYDGSVILWSPGAEPGVFTLSHAAQVDALAYSPSGKWIVSGGYGHRARLWDSATGSLRFNLQHEGNVRAVAFSRDERLLATASSDGTARIWEVNTGREIARLLHQGFVGSVAFSPDGRVVVTGGADNRVRLWSTVDGAPQAEFVLPDTINEVAFSPDGEFVASASEDQTARVWNIAGGREVFSIGFQGPARSLAFSPDGKFFAAGGVDNVAQLWQMASGRAHALLKHNGPIKILRFSPDSRWLATGSTDNSLALWRVESGKLERRLLHQGSVQAVAFSRDGKLLATGSNDRTARVWDLASGVELVRIQHVGPVSSIAFDPIDAQRLATSSTDNAVWVRTWDRPVALLLSEACARLGRNLNPEEWKRYFDDEPIRPTCPELEVTANVESNVANE